MFVETILMTMKYARSVAGLAREKIFFVESRTELSVIVYILQPPSTAAIDQRLISVTLLPASVPGKVAV